LVLLSFALCVVAVVAVGSAVQFASKKLVLDVQTSPFAADVLGLVGR